MLLKNIRIVLAILPALFLIACNSSSGSGSGSGGGGGGGTMDPLFSDQWHLDNTGQQGGTVGQDINVDTVWATYEGTGVRIAIVDDGLEIAHEDLAANVVPGASYNYLNMSNDPTTGEHGTAVSGVSAAVGLNDIGVRGVAYAAELVGYNMLQVGTDANVADALSRGITNNDIYNNSWGPGGSVGFLSPLSAIITTAISSGVSTGRGGLGAVYVFAAGNSHGYTANTPPGGRVDTNYSETSNNENVITVAAVDDRGVRSVYSQEGASVLVAAPSGNWCQSNFTGNINTTTTTDRTGALGYNTGAEADDYMSATNYTQCFNGTSSATPVVSGAIALILEAKPTLGWRDVRQILAQTARKNDAGDGDWAVNGAGLDINHKYGFGVIDTQAAVTATVGYTNLGTQSTFSVGPQNFSTAALDGSGNLEQTPVFGAQITNAITVAGSGLTTVETVAVTYTSDHTFFADLEVELVSPAGTISKLANPHWCYDSGGTGVNCGAGYSGGWTFTSVRHMGEVANGIWTLRVRDGYSGDTETLVGSWSLAISGT